ncbi:minor capsid protein [Solwaraspora sp. WMMD1047]|uniref:minor capsid protein n=1 Tax=Solwaraspora sp. WMMD1047 TaxID=3016102 RepID=UPI002415A2E8|nr:minor capsid protein [Solwaraspora sp. WMMD1047]MDG4832429.1 minor capsid protein [Solwaraspora sp. WMMD1047]
MAIGDGWTSRLLTGLAELLDAAGVGDWRPSGAYAAGETAIVIRAVPQAPDRLITLAAYPVGQDYVGLADSVSGVQIRVRAGADPRDCDDLADAIYEALDGLTGVTWGGIPIVQVRRQSYTSLGTDTSGRWERSENYYIDAMRPTAWNTD